MERFDSLNHLLLRRSEDTAGRWIFLKNRGREEHPLNYAQLDQRARTVARTLQDNHCAPGDRVVLLFQTGPAFLEAFFGCLYGGAVAVPLNPPRPNRKKDRYQAVFDDSGAVHVLTDRVTAASLADLGGPIQVIVVEDVPTDSSFKPVIAKSEDLAFLQYTSGSTGTPKGVMISHGNLLANLEVIREAGVLDGDVFVNWLPFFHDMGLIHTLLEPLYTNNLSVHLPPQEFMQRPITWLKAIEHYRGTICGGPNFAFEQCIRRATPELLAELDLSSWNGAFTGAEPVRAATLEAFAEVFAPCGFKANAFYPCYGLAEATLMVSGGSRTEAHRALILDRDALAEHRVVIAEDGAKGSSVVDCGWPRPGFDLRIVDPHTRAVLPDGRIGEIWVAGDSVATGYWRRDEATVATFHNQVRGSDARYMATGDLGFLDDGRLYLTSRVKDLIIVRGRNYVPADIETTAALAHPDLYLDGTAAIGIEDGETKLVIVQEIIRGKQNGFDFDAARDAIRFAVSDQQELQVADVVFLKQGGLPKTSSGKIQRSATKQAYLAGALPALKSIKAEPDKPKVKATDTQSTSSRTDVQQLLTTLVAERLGKNPAELDPRQPLALYGMDSPTALGILGDLERKLDRELSPTLVYEYPTIIDLARYLAGEKLDSAQTNSQPLQQPIAIVGASCRFPGAADLESFWELLREGRDTVTDVPESRWRVDDHYDPTPGTPDKMITRRGGFIDDVDHFDADLFNIADLEAENMDPQQRLLLEVAWEAMDHTGFGVDAFRGTDTGVYVGLAGSDYSIFHLHREGGRNAYAGIGSATSIAANRISWQFDLRGPSLAIDTACSAALVAIDRAVRSIEQGECHTALAGAVNLIFRPELTTALSHAGMMSPDGRCHAFDARANGYVRAEGCAMIVLKPLSDAVRDGNHIMGVIRGTATNQDGRGNGLTAPNGRAQKEVIRAAMHRAAVKPAEISYVEAHGTGTALGDPIEMEALKETMTQDRQEPCLIGSVKTNIGHTETVAGAAGLLKVLLALREQNIPKQLHLENLNPHIKLDGVPLQIATEDHLWPRGSKPRIAGVSSFGFGGANAHMIVSEAPQGAASVEVLDAPVVLPLSAGSPDALAQAETRLKNQISERLDLRSAAYTLTQGRKAFAHRAAWIAASPAEATEPARIDRGVANEQPSRVAFMFPGQGSQFPGMGADLYARDTVYREALDQCAEHLREPLGFDLRTLLAAEAKDDQGAAERITQTQIAQPALFAVSYATAKYWMARGVEPVAMIGHSIGEYVAATLAGVFTLEAALKLVARRGELMQSMPAGAMLAVPLSEEEITPYVNDQLSLAALNGPGRSVVSGPHDAIAALTHKLKDDGVTSRPLVTSHAFHSHMMTPILDSFRAAVAAAKPQAPKLPFIADLSGDWINETQACDPDYWAGQLRGCVRFEPGLRKLSEAAELFLEVGAGDTLCKLGRGVLGKEMRDRLIPSLGGPREKEADHRLIQRAAARLWVQGGEITLAEETRTRAALPPLSMTRRRFWVEEGQPNLRADANRRLPDMADWFAVPVWKQAPALTVGELNPERMLVFHDESETAEHLCHHLRLNGSKVISLHVGQSFHVDSEDRMILNPRNKDDYQQLAIHLKSSDFTLSHVCHLWLQPDQNGADLHVTAERCLDLGFFSLIFFLQAMEKQGSSTEFRLLAVTRGAYAIESVDHMQAGKASLLGPVTVIRREYPDLKSGHLDLAESANAVEAVTHILNEFADPETAPTVAVRGRHRWERIFNQVKLPAVEQPQLLSRGGVYWITGGLGAVGRAIAGYLANSVQAKLVLMSRSPLPERETWDAKLVEGGEVADRILAVQAMEAAGSEVLSVSGDVTDAARMADIAAEIEVRFGAIDGVVHAAGVPGDGMIRLKDEDQARRVLEPKITGSLVLEQVFAERQPDFILYCSSVFALAGEFGQVDYCAANAFQDHLAEALDRPHSRRISISWGTWREGGMAARMNLSPTFQESHQRQLRLGLSAAEGGEAFGRALHYGQTRVAVATVDLTAMLQAYEAMTLEAQTVVDTPVETRARTSEQPYTAPVGEAEKAIAEIWSALTGVTPVSRDDSFFELGGDSLIATKMFGQIQQKLGVAPTIAAFYEDPTVMGLAKFINGGETREPERIPIVTRDQPLPLSFAQHRLWFDCQRHPNTHKYNLPGRLEIRGKVNLGRVYQALEILSMRHEVMRTRFVDHDGEPRQIIEREAPDALTLSDLREHPQAERRLAEILAEEARHIFDLTCVPLFRFHLIRMAEEHYVLSINFHHIIFDGWSEGVLAKDIAAAYFEAGEGMSQLDTQFADYAVWQRTVDQGQEEASWWFDHLQDAPRLLLPRDHAGTRPKGEQAHSLDAALVSDLRAYAADHQTTAYVLAMSAYLLTLHQRTGQRDLVLGVDFANRNQPGLTELIGFFVNPLPMRVQVASDDTYGTFAAKVRQTLNQCESRQNVPFHRLVEHLCQDREEQLPLIQSIFVQQNTDYQTITRDGVTWTSYREAPPCKFETAVFVTEGESSLQILFTWAEDLFTDEMIQAVQEETLTNLRCIIKEPTKAISVLEPQRRKKKALPKGLKKRTT